MGVVFILGKNDLYIHILKRKLNYYQQWYSSRLLPNAIPFVYPGHPSIPRTAFIIEFNMHSLNE